MGHSSVSFRGWHVVAKDYKIEVWLFLLIYEIDKLPDVPLWLMEAHNFWHEEAKSYANGCLDPDLDRFITDDVRLQLFRKVCQCVHESLTAHGNKMSKDFLNQLCGCKPPSDFQIDNDAELYLKFSRALLRLLASEQTKELEYA